MTNRLAISPIKPFQAHIRPPGSKSLTNRALLLAALANGKSTLNNALAADDTLRMFEALKTLGFEIAWDTTTDCVQVTGCGGRMPRQGDKETRLDLGNAGTAYRFLTAACCLAGVAEEQAGETDQGHVDPSSTYCLDGIERMRQRPIAQLVDALRQLGGKMTYLDQDGFPPLRVVGSRLTGGTLQMAPTLSSQYISALLQVGPCCEQGLCLQFDGAVTSRPYVEMTVRLMMQFGADVQCESDLTQVRVRRGHYQGMEYAIEPDASNASYFLAAAAITPGSQCTIEGLGKKSLQGDVGFADVLHQMGAGLLFGNNFITVMAPPEGRFLRGIDIDLNHMPDMAQTLAAVAVYAQGSTTVRNVGNLRIKETDRMEALRRELTKIGASVEIDGDDLTITPPTDQRAPISAGTTIDTYDDHRMAMSFSVIGLGRPGLVLNDPDCVNKTFPNFFEYLSRLEAPQ